MNREQAKSFLPIIQAFSEGKTIQSRSITSETPLWWDDNNPTFEIDDFDYRIKPDPKYRPFNNARECWEEMQKHQPFGWVKDMDGSKFMIETVLYSDGSVYISDEGTCYFSEMFENYVFADGTPFGVKIEEDKQ